MSHSFSQLYAHIIFSTKNREPFLTSEIRARVHAYLAMIARECGCPYVHVGGVTDHVHILLEQGKKMRVTNVIAKAKKESSKLIKQIDNKYESFYWQIGYGMFSVGPTSIQKVRAYIDNQEAHHHKITFQEEFMAYLHKYNIKYDERYLWD